MEYYDSIPLEKRDLFPKFVQEQGISVLNDAIVACTQAIEQKKGKLVVKEAPRAVSDNPLNI